MNLPQCLCGSVRIIASPSQSRMNRRRNGVASSTVTNGAIGRKSGRKPPNATIGGPSIGRTAHFQKTRIAYVTYYLIPRHPWDLQWRFKLQLLDLPYRRSALHEPVDRGFTIDLIEKT